MDPIIGIDLGTTNSAAALLGADGPRILPNVFGESLTPSVVGIDEDGRARDQLLVTSWGSPSPFLASPST